MDPLLLRFLERLTVVLFSGMAIYLGFRLFLAVPEQRDASGEIRLPKDISIVMSRIGPGAFFALFGIVALSLALLQPLEFNLQESGAPQSFSYIGGNPAIDAPDPRDARALLYREFTALNTIPELLSEDLAESDRNDILRNLRRVKLKLLEPVWGQPEEGFGEFSEFERWVQEGEPVPPPAGMEGALDLYLSGLQ